MFTDTEIVEIARPVSNLLQRELDKLPYSANVIDELHANENAHSRILRMLLQYCGGRTWPIYHSFLELMKKHCLYFSFDCSNPQFANEKDRIDLLITDISKNEKWALIIENKVLEADDQSTQIERYINKVETSGLSQKNIFVVYLTADGTKEVSSKSLTDSAKEKLDYKGDADEGRFVKLNYLNDILPWIENEVLPSIAIKEDLLISSLKLYIDYLKGMFGKRDNELVIHNKIQNFMEEKLQINSIQDGFRIQEDLNRFQNELNGIISKKATDLLTKHLKEPLSAYLSKHNGIVSLIEYYPNYRFCCRINLQKWQKLMIQITHEERVGIFGLCHIDYTKNPLGENSISKLREVFADYKKSDWWPVYNSMNKLDDNAGTPAFWKSIENDSFCKKFEQWIENVLKKTDGIEL